MGAHSAMGKFGACPAAAWLASTLYTACERKTNQRAVTFALFSIFPAASFGKRADCRAFSITELEHSMGLSARELRDRRSEHHVSQHE